MSFVERHHFDITIIGAGVVGLAIAEELSRRYGNILLLEKNESHGQETSSRSSEVIHAGIYYPEGSLKATLCIEGRKLLYEACEKRGIPHRRIGKFIVATNPDEEEALHALQGKAERKAANVVVEHGVCNAIPYPSHRRVAPRKKDGSPARGPVLIDLAIHDWPVVSDPC